MVGNRVIVNNNNNGDDDDADNDNNDKDNGIIIIMNIYKYKYVINTNETLCTKETDFFALTHIQMHTCAHAHTKTNNQIKNNNHPTKKQPQNSL